MRDLIILIIFSIFIGSPTLNSQSFNIDSMYQIVSAETNIEKKRMLIDSIKKATPVSDSLAAWTITLWMMDFSKETNDEKYAAKALLQQGWILEVGGHYEKSIEILNKGTEVLKVLAYESGDSLTKVALAYTYGTISNALVERKEFVDGLNYLQMTEQIFIELKDSMNIGRCRNSYGYVYERIGQYDKAVEFYNKALAIFLKFEFIPAMILSHLNLTDIFTNQKKFNKAEEHIMQALDLQSHEKNSKENDETEIYKTAAEFYIAKRDWDNSNKYLKKLIDINKARGNNFGEANGYILSATMRLKTGELTKVKSDLDKAKPLIRSEISELVYRWKSAMAEYFIKTGNFSGAEKLLEECQKFYSEVSDLHNSSLIYFIQAELEKKRGNENGVYTNLNQAYHIKDSILNHNTLINSELFEVQFKTKEKEQEIALLSEKEKVQTAQITASRNRNILLLSLLGLLLAGGGAIYYRRQLSEQMRLQSMRTQISSDLHDEVGSSLAQLSMIMSTIEGSEPATAKKYLKKGNEILMSSISKIRDVVWAIDAQNDEAGSLLDRMEDFAYDMFASKEIRYKINTQGFDRKEALPPLIRQNMYLFYKEAITNIHKHSNATEVKIDFSKQEKNISLTITDNGKDLNDKMVTGSGISNMELRAKKIGGKFNHRKSEDGFVVKLEVVS